jgi:hypothetical protein
MSDLHIDVIDAIESMSVPCTMAELDQIAITYNLPITTVIELHDELFASMENEQYRDDMDGDNASALASAGYGTDEDYGYYGDNDYY